MKQKRTVYRVDIPKLKSYAAKMASNGIYTKGYPGAVEMLKEIMFAQHGMDKRQLTDDECTHLIHAGGFR